MGILSLTLDTVYAKYRYVASIICTSVEMSYSCCFVVWVYPSEFHGNQTCIKLYLHIFKIQFDGYVSMPNSAKHIPFERAGFSL